ncbi:MAG: hypothetical protein COA58_10020 [Bacteroidetes bacterium]|nr:MAG: hypothetical protein COA58_10020 [Bacteroidota bacterium]
MNRLLLILICCIPISTLAQIGNVCVDSNRVNPYYQCNNPEFNPVCGCDNVTYRNGCEMTNVGGVNYPSPFENGVCQSDFFFYFFSPNPVIDRIDFSMQFADQKTTTASLQIYNIFGHLVFYRLLTNITSSPSFPQTIYFNDLQSGVYVMLVQAGGVYKHSKFIKHTY